MTLPSRLSTEYTINKELGQGSYGAVYQVTKNGTKEKYAIKVMKVLTLQAIDRSVIAEIQFLVRLREHPNIARVFDFEIDLPQKIAGVVMELCDEDLHSLINRDTRNLQQITKGFAGWIKNKSYTRMQLQQRLQIVLDVFHGLQFLKENQIVWSDGKPANILILNGRAKISDFGISTFNTTMRAPFQKGTIAYESPEMLCNLTVHDPENFHYPDYSYPSDTWSMGVILAEMFFHINVYRQYLAPLVSQYNASNEMSMWNIITNWVSRPTTGGRDYGKCGGLTQAKLHQHIDVRTSNFLCLGQPMSECEQRYQKLYGKEVYNEMLDLIHDCLAFHPQDRIKYDELSEFSMFKTYKCEWEVTVHGKHLHFDHTIHLQILDTLELCFRQNHLPLDRRLLACTSHIHTKYMKALNFPKIKALEDQIALEFACFSLAVKALDMNARIFTMVYQCFGSTLISISIKDLAMIETSVLSVLKFQLLD